MGERPFGTDMPRGSDPTGPAHAAPGVRTSGSAGTAVSTEVAARPSGGAPPPDLHRALAGLDALEEPGAGRRASPGRRLWAATWPKLGALAIILVVWQTLAWAHWKPYSFQSPATVARELWVQLATTQFWQSVAITAEQAAIGFALVVVVGGVVGAAVARVPVLRSAIGSLITGVQTMPSVLWYPVAYMCFGQTWSAAVLMMVLGGWPAVANGVITGIDQVPPGMIRVGRVLGARGLALERRVVVPAAFPTILGGLKQGWAFAWHALMAGEFLILVNPLSLGGRTVNALTQAEYSLVVVMMIVIVVIGIVVDLAFSRVDRSVRRRYGLIETAER